MKALLIGGTGVISTSVTRLLLEKGWDVVLCNRGSRNSGFPGAEEIRCDIHDESAAKEKLKNVQADVVCDFIAFEPADVERDIRLFEGRTGQYILIATAAAYKKPASLLPLTEGTVLANPFWDYAQKKIACEQVVLEAYRKTGFPFTIVRPSHTFSERSITVPIHGDFGAYQVLKRMRNGQKVLVPGDGETLWTITPARDFAKGFVGLMGNPAAIAECVHITGDKALTWNQIMRIIAKAVNGVYDPCYIPAHLLSCVKRYDYTGALLGDKAYCAVFDNRKLKSLVPGFSCDTPLKEALTESAHQMMTLPELRKPDPEFDAFTDHVADIMEEAKNKLLLL